MIIKKLFPYIMILFVFSTAHGEPTIIQMDNCSYIGTYNNLPIKLVTGSYPPRYLHLTSQKPAASIYLDQLNQEGTLFLTNQSSQGTANLLGGEYFVGKVESAENESPVTMGFYLVPSFTEWFKLATLDNIYWLLPLHPNWSSYQKTGVAQFSYQGCNHL